MNIGDFNYIKKADMLIKAGIIAFILSVAYFFIADDMKNFGGQKVVETNMLEKYVAYFLVNSFLTLVSGFLLKKKNIIGVVLFIILVLSIISSIFVPNIGGSGNLFTGTIIFSIPLVIPLIGVYLFFRAIITNLFSIKKWFKLIREQNTNLVSK